MEFTPWHHGNPPFPKKSWVQVPDFLLLVWGHVAMGWSNLPNVGTLRPFTLPFDPLGCRASPLPCLSMESPQARNSVSPRSGVACHPLVTLGPRAELLRTPKEHEVPYGIHLYSWYGSKKLCFLQTPSKNEQNQMTKKPKNMPRTVKGDTPGNRTLNDMPSPALTRVVQFLAVSKKMLVAL